MTQTYRWNVSEHAAGYDAAAEVVHPYYEAAHEAVIDQIARPADADFLLVDLGGGSGRLVERFLKRFSRARAVVVDQSEAFLEIARARLAPFAPRADFLVSRLQDDWGARLPEQPTAIVSTSAIHHLEPAEKRAIYQQCYDALVPMGVLANGDEVRSESDQEYRAALQKWSAHMQRIMDEGLVVESFHGMLHKWQERNVTRFEQPRISGDDCHETIRTQLAYLADCGFRSVSSPWQQEMWAVLLGIK